jgi:Short repeat of unknown function (DUF308)
MATVNPTQGLQGAEKFVKKASGLYMRWRWRSSFSGPWRSLSPELRVLAVAVLVGWLLIFGGGAHLVAAFSGGAAGRALWHVLVGLLYFVGGIYFLMHPLLGLESADFAVGRNHPPCCSI